MFELLIREAVDKKLVTQDDDKDLFLTEKGKFYAVEHKIVNE